MIALPVAILGQICDPNGITTSPYIPDVSTGSSYVLPDPAFENNFEWFGNDGQYLFQFPLNNMDGYTSVQAMESPYNGFANLTYPFLTLGVTLDELDMYPEQGWELLSVNLGSYPSGLLLAAHLPSFNSANDRTPYLILYNKQRGIIRIFCNYYTTESYDKARVTLLHPKGDQFNPIDVSGLLRYTPMARVCNPCLHLPGLSAQFSIHLL